MKKIKLSQNQFTLVDNKDFKYLNKFNWYVHSGGNTVYAARNSKTINGKRKTIWMHKEIMKTPKGMETDHIDGNGLNNQRKNLRICTKSENQHNRSKYKCNTSGFKGVSWHIGHKKWGASIQSSGKQIYLGYYDSKIEAYNAYCNACTKYHRDFAKIK